MKLPWVGPTRLAVGQALKAKRLELKISARELELRAGLSKGYVYRVESGLHSPRMDTLFRICNQLGVALYTSDDSAK